MAVAMTVNRRPVALTVEPRETLAHVLRERLGLTGTKLSCGAQVCGACTVLVDGLPVSACTLLAVDVEGREVRTIEGASDGERLHPVQRAFIEQAAFQCGFCTPGMIMTTIALLESRPQPTRAEVVEGLEGNICRCTGYQAIIEAVLAAAREPAR